MFQQLLYCVFHFQEIKLGEANIVLTGGTESMSQAPYAVRNARWGSPLGVDLKVSIKLTMYADNIQALCHPHLLLKKF